MPEVAKDFVIQNEYGFHARPAASFVKIAGQYSSEIMLEKDGMAVSGKSIMGLLTIEGHKGCAIRIIATGDDAEDAVKALGELIDSKFGED